MNFNKIDLSRWVRREHFEHYTASVPCTYSMTVPVDVAPLHGKTKLYPALVHAIATVVNRHEEFRTAFDAEGTLGVYDALQPGYTVFHRDTETFSALWTEYRESYPDFLALFDRDLKQYGDIHAFQPKKPPENLLNISMIPWAPFTAFHLNLAPDSSYLLPIFTLGRYEENSGKLLLPLAAQVHHGVCDGFHLSRFYRELQETIDALGNTLPAV